MLVEQLTSALNGRYNQVTDNDLSNLGSRPRATSECTLEQTNEEVVHWCTNEEPIYRKF
jgi:hypothetical protein